jgi:hypothetical protein
MALKLGELLISEGKITQGQLDEALKCHVIFGIKLGSSLVELGFIKEDVLNDLLSRKLGVPLVSHAELNDVPSEAVARFSPAVAEKYRVMPIRLENKRLHVAMSDPTDFKTQKSCHLLPEILLFRASPLISRYSRPLKNITMSNLTIV